MGVLPMALLSGLAWLYLKRKVVSTKMLAALDALFQQAAFALALAPYPSHYGFSSPGHVSCVATVAIITLVRGNSLPSSGLRTLLISLPSSTTGRSTPDWVGSPTRTATSPSSSSPISS